MSVAYEPPTFHHASRYAPVGESTGHDDHDHDHDHDHDDPSAITRYINTDDNVDMDNDVDMENLAAATYGSTTDPPLSFHTPDDEPDLDLGPPVPQNVDPANLEKTPSPVVSPESLEDADSPSTPPSPSSRIAKPIRAVTLNAEGLFECRWPGCKARVKTWRRKCEWGKHMDKHERPFLCTVQGCQRREGFTYGGGLLRHQREVHGKHGGPRNRLNCPHPSCKRHTGARFKRLENLNEHLRRCHRETSIPPPSSTTPKPDDDDVAAAADTDDMPEASDVAAAASAAYAALNMSRAPTPTPPVTDTPVKNKKRKAESTAAVCERGRSDEVTKLKEENERLRLDKEELSRQLQEQTQLNHDMRAQLESLQAAITQTLQEPRAPVL